MAHRGNRWEDDNLPLVINVINYRDPIEYLDAGFSHEWLNANLEQTSQGWIAYRRQRDCYPPPEDWIFEPLKWLFTGYRLDKDSNRECGAGVHAATLDWLKAEYPGALNQRDESSQVWKVLIPFDAIVVVPYTTAGQFRCDKLQLLERNTIQ